MSWFLGFSYNVHDSSVSLADERQVRLVLEAERLFGVKKKHCSKEEMEMLVKKALDLCGIDIADIKGVSCTAYRNEHLPSSLRNVEWTITAPVTLNGKSFAAVVLNHHVAHAAAVYAFPEAKEADVRINVCDGGGDFGRTHANMRLHRGRLESAPLTDFHQNFSCRFYDRLARYLYGSLMCEGKMMALAALGTPRGSMREFLQEHAPLFSQDDFSPLRTLLEEVFPVAPGGLCQNGLDLAATAQAVFESGRVRSVGEMAGESPYVMLAGGASLNILANTRVVEQFDGMGAGSDEGNGGVLVPSCPDDTGQSLGALLYLCHEVLQNPVECRLPFLGYADKISAPREEVEEDEGPPAHLTQRAYDHLMGGGILFLHRGQSEVGPRALGHRSILALPTGKNIDLINHVIKEREFYRPVAPLVPAERMKSWFSPDVSSTNMAFAPQATREFERLAPAVCHYDGTVRVQSVAQELDPWLHGLLMRLEAGGQPPILTNTSLNLKGRPIAATRKDTAQILAQSQSLGVAVLFDDLFIPGDGESAKPSSKRPISMSRPWTGGTGVSRP